MATLPNQSLDFKKKIYSGLSPFVDGSGDNADGITGMNEAGFSYLYKDIKGSIDSNAKTKKPPSGVLLTNEDDNTVGVRDTFLSYIKQAQTNEGLKDPKQVKAVKSLLGATGYETDLDAAALNEKEKSELGSLYERLSKGVGINNIFNDNYKIAETQIAQDQKAAADQALQVKNDTDLNNKYNAGLVYSGYLKPEDIDKPLGSATAMTKLIINEVAAKNQGDVQEKMYVDRESYKPNANALTFLNEHMGNTAQFKVQADLESGDPKRVAMAQSFLALQGVKADGQTIEATGTIDSPQFKNAAEAFIRQPLTVPAGLVDKDGVDRQKLAGMAASGQLYLPESALKDDEREALKGFTGEKERRQFIANRLILDDPKRYEAVLASENEQRAKITLNVKAPLDLKAMSLENVAAPVQENVKTLTAIAMPTELAATIVKYAADHGGKVEINKIPTIVAQADGKGSVVSEHDGMDATRARIGYTGMKAEEFDQSIKIQPGTPEFEKNMTEVLKRAYALENKVNMASIPPETLASFDKVSAEQSKISTAITSQQTNDFGLSNNFLSRIDQMSKGGAINPSQVVIAMKEDNAELTARYAGTNSKNLVDYNLGLQQLAGENENNSIIANAAEGSLNIKNPEGLALAMQIGVAVQTGKPLQEIRADAQTMKAMDAAAQGYLGVNVDPASKPVVPSQDPEKAKPVEPVVAEKSKGWLSNWFSSSAEASELPAKPAPVADNSNIKYDRASGFTPNN